MKKTVLIAAMLLTVIGAKAQTNIQEMYDYNRGHFTTTLEMFKADNWGSTFFFTDIYHKFEPSTPTDFYTEIARSLNFWQNSSLGALSLHVEWNGGCGIYDLGSYDAWGGYQVKNAWLFGIEYFLHNSDFSNTFTFELLYKHFSGQKAMDARPDGYFDPLALKDVKFVYPFAKVSDIPIQFTFVWGMQNLFGVKGLVFSGFLDIWGENICWNENISNLTEISRKEAGLNNSDLTWDNTKLVILSEPQIWYNVGQHFGCENLFVGGEVELAYNFSGGCGLPNGNKGFTYAPALGIKWAF